MMHLSGSLSVTKVDLKFWRQFDSKMKIGKYKKGFKTYDALTKALHDWANKIVLQLAKNTVKPDNYVFVENIEKTHGGQARCTRRTPRARQSDSGSCHGDHTNPPNWGHPIAQKEDDEDHFRWTDELIDLDVDHNGVV